MAYVSIEEISERILSRSVPTPGIMETDCLQFTGCTPHGYGMITRGIAVGKSQTVTTHRAVWEARNGPIPDGMTIDHLCLNRGCQNIEHMEVVSRSINSKRAAWMNAKGTGNAAKTHCPHGHAYSEENTYIMPSGSRFCRTCGNERTKAWQRKKKAERASLNRAGGQQ